MMKSSLAVLALLLSAVTAAPEKCHAMSLSGGANKGAYEMGAIYSLVNNLPAEDVAWQSVAGVSAGSIGSSGMALFAVGDEKAMADYLVGLIRNFTDSDVWVQWPGGWEEGLTLESGLINSDPLLHTMQRIFKEHDNKVQRKLTLSAVNVNNGTYEAFTEENTAIEDLPLAAVSSSSIPFVFPNRKLKGITLMDGGTVWNSDPQRSV